MKTKKDSFISSFAVLNTNPPTVNTSSNKTKHSLSLLHTSVASTNSNFDSLINLLNEKELLAFSSESDLGSSSVNNPVLVPTSNRQNTSPQHLSQKETLAPDISKTKRSEVLEKPPVIESTTLQPDSVIYNQHLFNGQNPVMKMPPSPQPLDIQSSSLQSLKGFPASATTSPLPKAESMSINSSDHQSHTSNHIASTGIIENGNSDDIYSSSNSSDSNESSGNSNSRINTNNPHSYSKSPLPNNQNTKLNQTKLNNGAQTTATGLGTPPPTPPTHHFQDVSKSATKARLRGDSISRSNPAPTIVTPAAPQGDTRRNHQYSPFTHKPSASFSGTFSASVNEPSNPSVSKRSRASSMTMPPPPTHLKFQRKSVLNDRNSKDNNYSSQSLSASPCNSKSSKKITSSVSLPSTSIKSFSSASTNSSSTTNAIQSDRARLKNNDTDFVFPGKDKSKSRFDAFESLLDEPLTTWEFAEAFGNDADLYTKYKSDRAEQKKKMELEARKHDRQCQPTNKSTAFNSADQHHSRPIHFFKGSESPKTLDQDSESFPTTSSITFDEITPSADPLPSYDITGEKFNTTSNSKPKKASQLLPPFPDNSLRKKGSKDLNILKKSLQTETNNPFSSKNTLNCGTLSAEPSEDTTCGEVQSRNQILDNNRLEQERQKMKSQLTQEDKYTNVYFGRAITSLSPTQFHRNVKNTHYYNNDFGSEGMDSDGINFCIGSNGRRDINVNNSSSAEITLDTGLGGFNEDNKPKKDNLKDLENVPCEPFPLVPGSEGKFNNIFFFQNTNGTTCKTLGF